MSQLFVPNTLDFPRIFIDLKEEPIFTPGTCFRQDNYEYGSHNWCPTFVYLSSAKWRSSLVSIGTGAI